MLEYSNVRTSQGERINIRASGTEFQTIARLVGAAGFEPATAGLEIRCSIRLSYAPSLVFSSVYQLRLLRKLYKSCTCLKSLAQLTHGVLNSSTFTLPP